MIVDTSALLAVLFDEPDAMLYARTIAEAPNCRMSVANFMEAAFVVESRAGVAGGHELDLFLEAAAIDLEPVTVEQARAARRAWRRFGKGNHRAGMNFGDCFAYALSEITGEPLLYKGADFALTDVETTQLQSES
ncbi:MAG: type II toxin-antitoxin system VapC family toxin [Chloroflexi bacterium]|nr:type II toxin-antitoxin system VapC family toxin [Chloroflexota bacterium]